MPDIPLTCHSLQVWPQDLLGACSTEGQEEAESGEWSMAQYVKGRG